MDEQMNSGVEAQENQEGQESRAGTRISLPTENMVRTKSASGGISFHCGDAVAQALAGLALHHVKTLASEALGIDTSKYEHLNNGQQRMTLGNVIRNMTRRDEALIVPFNEVLVKVQALAGEEAAKKAVEEAEANAAKEQAKKDAEALKQLKKAEALEKKEKREADKKAAADERAEKKAAKEAEKAAKKAEREQKALDREAEKQRKADERQAEKDRKALEKQQKAAAAVEGDADTQGELDVAE